ncbi:PrsW family glutamic-type intramembrane protease [Calothrix sp. 336/3]|uniref:PrsW family glutamic-type intramembrane protease n=1 Tax=Calothrix sp. 336/3 TaxID=1337936 RepID=UPI0004E3BBB8|nr:PrsW family glutamic-type intramembrane protease [Calothrix sp. 336/3]AKG20801.1 hypothetical protein IJ00_05295 [Calothrix sp. 336/3]
MTDFYSLLAVFLWAVIPPLLFLLYYSWRVSSAPPLPRLLLFFIFGVISGAIALFLSFGWEIQAHRFWQWQVFKRTFGGIFLRQLLQVSPIEESCKLAAVAIPVGFFQRRYRLRPSSIFLFSLASALGFSAHENWIYLFHETSSPVERLIGTPGHAIFSAPWGYALALSLGARMRLSGHQPPQVNILSYWLQSVLFHALANTISSTWGFSLPLRLLSYAFFPFMLWMFWRLEQYFRKIQGKLPIVLISGYTPLQRYWQRGLVLFTVILAGNAILGLFLLIRIVATVPPVLILSTKFLWFILSRSLLNILFAAIAWFVYRYLRYLARRRFF